MLDRVTVNGVELEYELRGTGDLSCSSTGVWAPYGPGPLLDQPALADCSATTEPALSAAADWRSQSRWPLTLLTVIC